MTTAQTIQRRDRWADWTVIAVVAIALIVGLILRELVLSRTAPFRSSETPSPSSWQARMNGSTKAKGGRGFSTASGPFSPL